MKVQVLVSPFMKISRVVNQQHCVSVKNILKRNIYIKTTLAILALYCANNWFSGSVICIDWTYNYYYTLYILPILIDSRKTVITMQRKHLLYKGKKHFLCWVIIKISPHDGEGWGVRDVTNSQYHIISGYHPLTKSTL